MDHDYFIITAYCLVCEHYRAILKNMPLCQASFTPALTDEEVITLEVCGKYFKCGTDKDLFGYFQAHYADWFPHLIGRSLFAEPRICGGARPRFNAASPKSADRQMMPCKRLTRSRYRSASIHAVAGTAVSKPQPIAATVPRKTCITTASNWVCAWRAQA